MSPERHLPTRPAFIPPLDREFQPAALYNRSFSEMVDESGRGVPLTLALDDGVQCSHYESRLLPAQHPQSSENLFYTERLVKFLLWQRGGHTVYIGGPLEIAQAITEIYSPRGGRSFEYHFMGEDVYEKPFTVVATRPEEIPPPHRAGKSTGRHLKGCRIGFDLGASDRKVSAVVDGRPVFSEEVIWEPGIQPDPEYHYLEIMAGITKAKDRMPRLDAIGGSSAGIIINNRIRIASLFRAVPKDRYHLARNIFIRIGEELGVPIEVANDGDVTALAGSMSLEDNAVLGIALGSSEAGGYVDQDGHITGWLNELAFAPIDNNPAAPVDEWSGEAGTGAQYLSQQCVFRLAPKAGIQIPAELGKAEKLKFVQDLLEDGHPGARQIWESMGIYLGYAIAHYAGFYDLRHVLILGRCTSGSGGEILLHGARQVLESEFPSAAGKISLQLPDEKSRRVGQSIAAASLPDIA